MFQCLWVVINSPTLSQMSRWISFFPCQKLHDSSVWIISIMWFPGLEIEIFQILKKAPFFITIGPRVSGIFWQSIGNVATRAMPAAGYRVRKETTNEKKERIAGAQSSLLREIQLVGVRKKDTVGVGSQHVRPAEIFPPPKLGSERTHGHA